MARFNLTQLWVAILAAFCRAVAPFHKPALVRQIDRRSNLAADQLAHRLFLSHDRKGNCRQKCSGIWEHLLCKQGVEGSNPFASTTRHISILEIVSGRALYCYTSAVRSFIWCGTP